MKGRSIAMNGVNLLKRGITAFAFSGLLAAGVWAQSTPPPNPDVIHDTKDIQQDRRDAQQDTQDIRQDRTDVRNDAKDVAHDQKDVAIDKAKLERADTVYGANSVATDAARQDLNKDTHK
jgi:hypothetical protein